MIHFLLDSLIFCLCVGFAFLLLIRIKNLLFKIAIREATDRGNILRYISGCLNIIKQIQEKDEPEQAPPLLIKRNRRGYMRNFIFTRHPEGRFFII